MEADFLRWLREHLPPHPLLKLGIGDDAAVLATAGRSDVVVTTDLLADGVDFDLKKHEPRRIGHKALAVNLSDLAAMAARPLAAVISLNLPRQDGMRIATELYEGMLPLAERYRVAIAGGDTNSWDGPLVISVTALGEVTADGPLRRSGAQPGDRIIVTGSFGGSILGRHLDVQPRIDEALLLNQRYSAARRNRLQRRPVARPLAPVRSQPLRRNRRHRSNSNRTGRGGIRETIIRQEHRTRPCFIRRRRFRTHPRRASRVGPAHVSQPAARWRRANRHRRIRRRSKHAAARHEGNYQKTCPPRLSASI